MYQPTIASQGFNHQLFYHQPVSNLKQANDVVWNQNDGFQQINTFLSNGYSMIPNQQILSQYENLQQQTYSTATNMNGISPYSNNTVLNVQENYIASSLPSTTRQSRSTTVASNTNQNRNLTRQLSAGAAPETRNTSSKELTPLTNSRSAGVVNDYIQRERRSHTMAPMSRITGPSTSIATTMFASTVAPSDARAVNTSHMTQAMPNAVLNLYPQSDAGRIDITSINDTERAGNDEDEPEEEEEEDEDDDDDDAPIIVKVRYDPDAGGPPSEDVIRQAVDHQLNGLSSPKLTRAPIVLNFLDNPSQYQDKQAPIRQQQPVFNRSKSSVPQQVIHPQQQISKMPISVLQPQVKQQNLSSLQQRHQQHQQFLQQQQRQQQQHQQFLQHQQRQQQQQQQQLYQQQLQRQKEQQQQQQQQLYQQQLQRQKEQQQQQRLHRQRQEQQQLQKQKQQEQQLLLQQQQKEKKQMQEYLLQVQIQNELKLEQQRKQQQILLDNQRIRQLIKTEQQEINRLISQQLQLESQQQEQQRYRQLYQQQQRVKPQQIHQRKQQVYQQPQQQYASLPPAGPRPSRTLPTTRTVPVNRAPINLQQNRNTYLSQPIPPAPWPLRNPQPSLHTDVSRKPVQPVQFASHSIASGPGLYTSLSHQDLSNAFTPIQNSVPLYQQYTSINNKSVPNIPQTLTKRPQTAPSFTEIFRTPSALDIPELSKESLSNMLNKIPHLHGSQFKIEYAESDESRNIPIPSQQAGDNDKYPEAVIVDQLPNNLIQHVNSSDNLELKAVINATMEDGKTITSTKQSNGMSSAMKKPLSNVMHTKARPKQNVKQSRSGSSEDSDDETRASSSDDETEFEETVIENVSLPKNSY